MSEKAVLGYTYIITPADILMNRFFFPFEQQGAQRNASVHEM